MDFSRDMTTPTASDACRAQTRREHILKIAAHCFAREGFHGTSIARLARAAEMSPGHLYYFFPNKEAIVAALVERKLEQSLEMARQFENAEDTLQAMLARVAQGLSERTDPERAALELEILAEAARNPRVAARVHAADAERRAHFQRIIHRVRHGAAPATADDAFVCELILALFEGLSVRAVSHPDLDRAALLPWLRAALHALVRLETLDDAS